MLDLHTNANKIKEMFHLIESENLNWFWLGYTGNSETIDVFASGNDVEKMTQETSSSKVLYGYARIKLKSSLISKYIYILWIGENSMRTRSITDIKNSNEIQKLCKTIHLQISARDESDINWMDIMKKMSACDIVLPTATSQLKDKNDVKEVNKSKEKEERENEMKSLIAARKSNLFEKFEQSVCSSYKRPNFKDEIAAARAMKHDVVEPVKGANYHRPDFKAEIELARNASYIQADNSVGANYQRPDFKSEIQAARDHQPAAEEHSSTSKEVSEIAVGTDTRNPLEVAGRYNFEAICLFAFESAMDDEITIEPGDKIVDIHQFDKNWLWGTTAKGKSGRFPASYVQLHDDKVKTI